MKMRLATALLAAAAVMIAALGSAQAKSGRWGDGYFPNLPVVTQDGKTLRFFDDVIKGRMVIIHFMFTSCTDICPLTTARLAQVAEQLSDRIGRDLFIVSLSVDPTNDTPAKLKAYADAFHAGPGWLFLTGTLADMRAINAKFGEHMRSLSDHRNEIVLGNDATGEWARSSVFGDMKRLEVDIREMDPKWRNQVRTVKADQTSDTGYQLNGQSGQALFKRLCAGCHMFKVGTRVGPDLYQVNQRRSHEWLKQFIMSPARMRQKKDPIALALAEQFKGVRMPNLGLSEADATDLIAYVTARSKWLDDEHAKSVATSPPGHHAHQHTHKH